MSYWTPFAVSVDGHRFWVSCPSYVNFLVAWNTGAPKITELRGGSNAAEIPWKRDLRNGAMGHRPRKTTCHGYPLYRRCSFSCRNPDLREFVIGMRTCERLKQKLPSCLYLLVSTSAISEFRSSWGLRLCISIHTLPSPVGVNPLASWPYIAFGWLLSVPIFSPYLCFELQDSRPGRDACLPSPLGWLTDILNRTSFPL